MEFLMHGKKHVLRGSPNYGLQTVKGKQVPKTLAEGVHISMLSLGDGGGESLLHSLTTHANQEEKHPAILELLQEFEDIFREPTELPPTRPGHDHDIPLLHGVNPVNARPYRYAKQQKDVIDGLIREYLKSGIIQKSSSPYASPVVLVGKKDGTWRLCVDYRELNKGTVKNKFPIPLVEDLMDELYGSVIYSKIDLRAGYNQVRMVEADVHKTAFRTHGGHYEYLVMPFGLTNAPATFQALMNDVFQNYLRKFLLVFFDDILIYSNSIEDHLGHLRLVLLTMREHSLFAKKTKCFFGVPRVEYLGHFISKEGIATDPVKVEAVQKWPQPKTVKQLRGFLGLAGYYRRFVRGYGTLAKPLTELLKKEGFYWNTSANDAFQQLKAQLTQAPVLALPDFSRMFILEVDASGLGIGAVLMQDQHPIAFISRSLNKQQQGLSTYEKELLAVVFAVQKWRHYLLPRKFIIRTDHRSLKFILEQKLSTVFQQKWLIKLMEFDFAIEYKQGKLNVAADALSRQEHELVASSILLQPESDLLGRIQQSWSTDASLQKIIKELENEAVSHKHYKWQNGELRRKGKLVIGSDPILRRDLLQWFHSSPGGGHSGRDATWNRIKAVVFWKGLSKNVRLFVSQCVVCQAHKYDNTAYPGLLQPLPIPGLVWQDISMDFIEGLPMSNGKQVIFVVVDRLSKAAHFMALSHPYTALEVAQVFLDSVFKLHGFPTSIVSDRDPVFVSHFWKEFLQFQGVQLHLSTAYHPQTDGQSEVVNRCLETYLRCMCSDTPRQWNKWLALAEWWYNSSYHTAIKTSPYEVVFGQPPPIHLPYLPNESKNALVNRSLHKREEVMKVLKFHLKRAQHRMQQIANRRRTERSFVIGDFVMVKLHAYRQVSVQGRSNAKLAPKYHGPFAVLDKVGAVAYRINLPPGSRVHNVFHVSQLKRFIGDITQLTDNPAAVVDIVHKEPEVILDRKMVKRGNRPATKVLVKWKHQLIEDATWEFYYDLMKKYPHFNP